MPTPPYTELKGESHVLRDETRFMFHELNVRIKIKKIITLHNECMLVKNGQNNNIIIYMTRQWYMQQDSYIYSRCMYIKIHIYIYIKICAYTSRFVSLNRPFAAKLSPDLLFIKLWAATLRIPEMEKACQEHQNGQV